MCWQFYWFLKRLSALFPLANLSTPSSDRFRTTNNLLGDCYTAAVVETWSRDALDAMDAEVASSSSGDTQGEKLDLADPDTRHLLLGGGVRLTLDLPSRLLPLITHMFGSLRRCEASCCFLDDTCLL